MDDHNQIEYKQRLLGLGTTVSVQGVFVTLLAQNPREQHSHGNSHKARLVDLRAAGTGLVEQREPYPMTFNHVKARVNHLDTYHTKELSALRTLDRDRLVAKQEPRKKQTLSV